MIFRESVIGHWAQISDDYYSSLIAYISRKCILHIIGDSNKFILIYN